jgi:hypothetical protein
LGLATIREWNQRSVSTIVGMIEVFRAFGEIDHDLLTEHAAAKRIVGGRRPSSPSQADYALGGSLSGVAMALGPTLGGVLACWIGRRAIFLASLLPCALVALAVPRLVGEGRAGARTSIDWPGLVFLTGALDLAVEGCSRARDPMRCVASLATGLALAVPFAQRQCGRAHPLIDPSLVSDRTVKAVVVLLVAVSAGYRAVLVSLLVFLLSAFGLNAQATARSDSAQAGVATEGRPNGPAPRPATLARPRTRPDRHRKCAPAGCGHRRLLGAHRAHLPPSRPSACWRRRSRVTRDMRPSSASPPSPG